MFFQTIVFVVLFTGIKTLSFEKCCDIDSFLVNNGTYECVKAKTEKRLQFLTDNYNFLAGNISEGVCVDVEDSEFKSFFLTKSGLILDKKIEDYFAKCCPLGFLYDTQKHACEPSNVPTTEFITKNLLKIGLPDCEFIDDYHYNSSDDFVIEENYIHLRSPNERHKIGSYCVDKNSQKGYTVRICAENSEEICQKKKCVHKCCPDGKSFVNGRNCLDTFTHGLDMQYTDRIQDPNAEFAIIHNYKCGKIYIMQPSRYKFTLDPMGNFVYFYNATQRNETEEALDARYCIEHVEKGKMNQFHVFKCFTDGGEPIKYKATLWAKIISVIGLVLTIFVYFYLGEVRRLFGKVLVNYCFAWLMVSGFLIYMHGKTSVNSDAFCQIVGYLVLYVTGASFTWLNVVCFDIWITIGSPRSFMEKQQRKRDLKKIILYLLYGWGLPLIIPLAVLIFNKWMVLPHSLQPYIGQYKCFLENQRPGNYGHIIFKEIPFLILETINVFLFLKTIIYCLKVKNEINRMNDTNGTKEKKRKTLTADKEKLSLIMKLCIITGSLFLFEVLSAFYDMSQNKVAAMIEIVWDTINCLQGLYIFIIFICKKKILDGLRKKSSLSERKISVTSTKFTEVDTNNSPVLVRKR